MQLPIMVMPAQTVRPHAHHLHRVERTSDKLLLRAFAAGLLVFAVLTAALEDALLFMSESLWLTHGGSMATDGATEGGAGSMSIDGVSSAAGAGRASWRVSWTAAACVCGLY
jgi:hypothetical protein